MWIVNFVISLVVDIVLDNLWPGSWQFLDDIWQGCDLVGIPLSINSNNKQRLLMKSMDELRLLGYESICCY